MVARLFFCAPNTEYHACQTPTSETSPPWCGTGNWQQVTKHAAYLAQLHFRAFFARKESNHHQQFHNLELPRVIASLMNTAMTSRARTIPT
jgi:hypothetical protein